MVQQAHHGYGGAGTVTKVLPLRSKDAVSWFIPLGQGSQSQDQSLQEAGERPHRAAFSIAAAGGGDSAAGHSREGAAECRGGLHGGSAD